MNKIQDAFETVKASEELKNATKEYLKQQKNKMENTRKTQGTARTLTNIQERGIESHTRHSAVKIMAMAGTLLFLLFGYRGYSLLSTPVYYVSIDVNPSVELTMNELKRVISAKAYNEDGEILLRDMWVKGKKYTEAIESIVESAAMQPYLTEDAALTFTITSNDQEKSKVLQAQINESSACRKHNGQSVVADITHVSEAHENGLSFGKYTAYLQLTQYDKSVTIEQSHHMTMSEIKQQIHAHENGCLEQDSEHNGEHHHEE
ncbi:MAG: hypothetical protein PHE02_13245 [Lachnospiraceae bacterium]|nr:hypothetical protein [Lachnospiraceae bacterium]